ncbi:hypothetical protein [Ramlibacter sp.]
MILAVFLGFRNNVADDRYWEVRSVLARLGAQELPPPLAAVDSRLS